MKVGFLQFDPVFGEKQENLDRTTALLADHAADIIVLPELFATGYTFLSPEELSALAEPAGSGPTYEHMYALSRTTKCCYSYGFAERDGDRIYNSAALVGPPGLIGIYRKNHLFFEEKLLFTPGDMGFPVFTYKSVCIGMLVCYDWIYPEAMRTLALKGAQIILHGANLVMPYCPDAHKTRALENGVFIVMANRTGEEHRGGKDYTFIGSSEIVSPRGEILVRVDQQTCVEVNEIDPDQALDKRMNTCNDLFLDRRQNIYFK
ncbi:acyltransferase [candidate division WOR-3 bacterium]|nr:acyltransferase [candidate division WOR-3 bacterium]